MAGRRSGRSGTGATDAVPDRLVSAPERLRTRPVRDRIGRTLLIFLLVVVSLADLFWLVAFFGTAIFDPGDINGMSDVSMFLIVQAILTGSWLLLRRALRGGRLGSNRGIPNRGIPNRSSGRGARRLVRRAIRPTPQGRHALAGNPTGTGPRTGLSAWQIDSVSWLTRADRVDVDILSTDTLARLAAAEQALGNALYELDLRRGTHSLSRERISALRVAGLEASAWLSTEADRATVLSRGTRPSASRVRDGVRRYADLARKTEDFLVGRTSVADLDSACESLARSRG